MGGGGDGDDDAVDDAASVDTASGPRRGENVDDLVDVVVPMAAPLFLNDTAPKSGTYEFTGTAVMKDAMATASAVHHRVVVMVRRMFFCEERLLQKWKEMNGVTSASIQNSKLIE
jgi:hypothetical protein